MEFVSRSKELIGSNIELKLPAEHEKFFSLCFSKIELFQSEFSRFIDSSMLSYVNKNLGKWVNVSDEFLLLADSAINLNKKTDGFFDITVKSTLDKLGYDKNYSFREKNEQKKGLAKKITNKLISANLVSPIVIDKKNKRIKVKKEIEFGGFGKGYILDKISRFLESNNILDYYINAGGDIYAKRKNPDEFWEILLEHPDKSEVAIGMIKINGRAIVCSAPNRRRWGKHHHLINPKTNLPEQSVKCIFVEAASGLEADGFATCLFAAGFEKGIQLSKKNNVNILIVSSDNKMYVSDGFIAEIFE